MDRPGALLDGGVPGRGGLSLDFRTRSDKKAGQSSTPVDVPTLETPSPQFALFPLFPHVAVT